MNNFCGPMVIWLSGFIMAGMTSLPFTIDAQSTDSLSLEKAIQVALENNHGIQVAENNATISSNNAHRGNANLLPSVDFSSGYSYSQENTTQEFSRAISRGEDGQPGQGGDEPSSVQVDNAASTNLNASLNASYTIFNGLGNIRDYERLKTEKKGSEVEARLTMENTLVQVINTFYQVTRLREQYRIAQESVALSSERLSRVESAYEFGEGSRVDVLNARVDLDTDSVNMVNAKSTLERAKRDLNLQLGRPVDTEYQVREEVTIADNLQLENVMENAREYNKALKSAGYQLEVAHLNEEITNAGKFPRVSMNAGYSFNSQNSEAGILEVNRRRGFSTGISISYNIFDGNRQNVREQNAAIRIDNSKQRYQETKKQVERDLLNAFEIYQNSLYTLKMERRNLENAQVNFERSQEAYQMGQINATQFREAQLNLIRSKNRLNNARYDAKTAEVDLLQLSGRLLEEDSF